MAWYPPTVTVAPAAEPITLIEAKAQCRVINDSEDTYITGLIAAARAYVEAYCGTKFASQTVTVKCDEFNDFEHFPVVPLTSVSSVSYVDAAGSTQTLSNSVYEVRSDGFIASLDLKSGQSWPDVQERSRITVTAVVGFATAKDDVRHAMLLLVGQWFENRSDAPAGAMVSMPHAVEALLTNHRVYAF